MKKTFIPRIKNYVKRNLGMASPKRALEVFDDDIFLVSYPKSGNTWVRFLLANLLEPTQDVNFSNIDSIVPDIYKSTTSYIQSLVRPRILKSHEYLDVRYKKVIYLVRDPRDVLVSYYHYKILRRQQSENYSIELFAKHFLDGTVDNFGSWSDHVGGWMGARAGTRNFVLVRYEDLLETPVEELERISQIFERKFTSAQFEQAVLNSSFDIMKNLEKTTANKWKTLKDSRKDKSFLREGRSETWKSELSSSIIKIIDEKYFKIMKRLNYK